MSQMNAIRKLLLCLIIMGWNIGVLQAQTYITFDISKGSIKFYCNGSYSGKDTSGNVVSGTHDDSNKYYVMQSGSGSTENFIFIETVNLFDAVPTPNNIGSYYDITFDNVNIDRSALPDPLGCEVPPSTPNWGYCYQQGLGDTNPDHHWTIRWQYANHPVALEMPFNAGDDTVDVTVTLIGTSTLKGEPGANAALQYMRCDGKTVGTSTCLGTLGDGKLTILGTGTLNLEKDGSMNAGACLGSPSCVGAGQISSGAIVIGTTAGGPTINAATGGPTGDDPLYYYMPDYYGSFAAAIGGGACCRSGNITIKGGTVTATSWVTAAAIGAGGGNWGVGNDATGTILIEGGSVTTYSMGSSRYDEGHSVGNGIGGGSAHYNGGGNANRIEITGGEVNVYQWDYDSNSFVYGSIGGGSSTVLPDGNFTKPGGSATMVVSGGTIHCGTIGGGNSVYGNAGSATVEVSGGYITANSIGGGNSLCDTTMVITGNGGFASVTVTGGTLDISGKIGGGKSYNLGNGGNASIYVTGGTLNCGSIGGGDSNMGTPGSVSADVDPTNNPLGAGIYIAGDNKITVKSGYIGGGTNTAGDIGKATAYVNMTHSESTLQGQFILCNNTSTTTDHCFFILENGTIDNTNLGAIGAASHPRMKAEGGAVYMEDAHGEVRISGGTIQNATGTLGGAVYMNNGSFTLSGTGVFQDNTATDKGGAVYLGGGTVSIEGGFIGGETVDDGNTATNYGGGLYLGGGSFEMKGGNVRNNKATSHDGGGVYIAAGGTVTVKGGTIHGNQALNGNGGGFFVTPGAGNTTTINSNVANTTISGNKAKYGGGAYVNNGILNIASTNGHTTTIGENNQATKDGGGIYLADGTVYFTDAILQGNEATEGFGGGLYLGTNNSNSMTVSGSGSAIKGNRALNNGGGIHVGGGTFTMTGGTIGGALADGNYTTAADSYGGGIYMGGGTATISNSTIGGNYTYSRADLDSYKGCGGAIYMAGGSCTLSNNATIGGANANYANTSQYGGAIYSADGTIRVKGGKIGYNKAQYGGGIYSNGDNAKVYVEKYSSKADVLSYIEYNEAQYGGGIFAQKGDVEFSDGYIRYNHASEQGGGIYVDASDTDADEYGKLYLKGSANLLGNHVPTDHNGGGVYLKGVLTIGEQVTPPAVLGTITANNNFAHTLTGSETAESYAATGVTNETRNNVFLPDPVVDNVHHKDVIEVIFEGIHPDSKIGFSVPANYVPVIYCKNNNIPCTETGYTGYTTSQYFLHQFSTGLPLQSRLFDDTDRYEAVHYINKGPLFDPNHVYLYGFWSNVVTGDPDDPEYPVNPLTFDPMKISTPAELAYFISWVNGLNGCDEHKSANGKLLADIDMHEYGWVPIGNTGTGYQGVFDGNGHTVSGISSMLNTDHMEYGFFGWLNGGTVKDLFIKGSDYTLEYKDGLYIGGVAGKTSGSAKIENCEAQSTITASHENTVMGGLVGATASGDQISSSIGIAEMDGFLMGGLTGQNGGVIRNSFANARFTYNGNDKYYGGLAGENTGTIENCYARLQNTGAMDNTWFGHLVGDNSTGTVKYSYAKAATYTASGKTGTLTEVGHYDDNTQTPYLYGRRDNQVHVAGTNPKYVPSATNPNPNPALTLPGDQQMLLCLERWVDTMNLKHGGSYKHWSRTTAKAINGDLPILKMDHGNVNAVYCAGNTDGTENEIYLNYGEINDILATQRQAGEAIWLYKNKDNMAGNNGSDAKLYIDEGVTVRQVADLYAYVGVTLDNSANAGGAHPTFPNSQGQYITDYTDWHMFSTPLANAPLGVNYKGDTNPYSSGDFSQPGHPDGMPYYQFYDNEEAASGDEDWERRGYFPSHVYNSTYTDDNTGETTGGNYYREWDFYTYFEPEYHWVNFKRNSNAHYHQNAPDVPIVYTHYDSETGNIVTGNETYLTQGRGYLLATREETFLQCHGLLNGTSGQVSIPVTYSGYYSPGYNFLGNPYLAYLDFDKFATINDELWGGYSKASYAVIDEDEGGYIYHAINGSANPNTAGQYIAPHQGFMILTHEGIDDDAAAYFYSAGADDMRELTAANGKFRDAVNYPLVNLIATDENGNRDIATVELGRPDRGGAPLMRELRQCKGHVWCHYEGNDWAIAFTRPGLTEAAIRFETYQDGEYTMRWNTQNGDFSYLHLVDNLTGADIDCLTTEEYRFTSTTMDYRSRFRLVFGYTGVEEPEANEPAQGIFAYQSGNELVVTGEGTVELFDVTGRRMSAERIEGVQGTMSVSGLTPGVYLLRLATATGTRVQKIVINQ